ncbi:hypothetical protein ACOSP7_012634 [Xanthoceras sorbifolium]
MTRSTSFLYLTLLFAAAVLVSQQTLAYAGDDIISESIISPGSEEIIPVSSTIGASPVNLDNLPPSPSYERLSRYLTYCVKKMSKDCSEEIYIYMFASVSVSNICCGELVKMGEPCHIALVKNVFALPENKPNATIGIARSKQLFHSCAAGVAPPS